MRFRLSLVVVSLLAWGQLVSAQTPNLPANSVVNGASFRPAVQQDGAVAPGALVAIFGSNLASGTQVALSVPLSTTLLDTSAVFTSGGNSVAAPLFFVSESQINAQVPFEIAAGAGVTVQVRRGSAGSQSQPVGMAAVSPGIFTTNQQGFGAGAILHNSNFHAVSDTEPAVPGEFLVIFCTGLGAVSPPVLSGNIAPSAEPLARTNTTPLADIAGLPAEVAYSGLAPGFVALYQVSVRVPAGAASGPAQPVKITIGGVPSNTVTIAIR